MKKLLLILITAVVGLVAHADKTIYYDNSATNWSTVKIHWWNSSTNGDDVMTTYSGKVYSGSIPDNAENMVFYNGSWNNKNQTEELGSGKNVAIQANHLYYGNGGNDSKQHSATDKGDVSNNTYSVYFYADNENAIDVYCHIWTASDGDITTWSSCPKMSDTGQYVKIGNDYHKAYSYTFVTAKTPASILFKKGTGDSVKYNNNCTFSNGKFYNAVANAGSCSPQTRTLVDKGGDDPDPDPEGYYVYFVNRNNWANVNIWAWNSTVNNLTTAGSWPGQRMELVSGNTYIWRLPAGKGVPTKVKFSNNGATATGDLKFVNHATYYPDGTIIEEVVGQPNVIYCHFKTDRVRRSGDNENAVPRCHVFTASQNLYSWGSDNEKMQKIDDPTDPNGVGKGGITDRYELWKFVIPEDKWQTYKNANATFYVAVNDAFNDDSKTSKWQTNEGLGNNRSQYLKDNWTAYIYATSSANNTNFACPSYVTPSEFLTLHKKKVVEKGRDGIFIIGPSNDFKYRSAPNDSWHQFANYQPTSNRKLTPDDGVFYLEVQPNANSYDTYTDGKVTGCEGNKFKLSFMDVLVQKESAKEREGADRNSDLANMSDWATFDLGAIGIDVKKAGDDYAKDGGPAGRTKFQTNKPYKYTNNNGCDWFIPNKSNASHWIVLDTHYDANNTDYQCESVTITDFDPHPSLKASISEISTTASLPAGAPSHPDFKAETANGNVTKLANVADATITINAATTNANFNRSYEVEFNGESVGNINGSVSNIEYKYFPFDVTDSAIKVRARYKDKNTSLQFHSRTGGATIENLTLSAGAPDQVDVTGKYVEEKLDITYDANNKPTKVERTFGVFVPDFKHNFSGTYVHQPDGGKLDEGELQAYADYEVYDENGNDITSQCKLFTGTSNETLKDRINQNFNNRYESLCWKGNQYTQHWAFALKNDTNEVPLYFETINDTPVADVRDLGDRSYTILLHAVYPICYNKNFSAGDAASTSSLDGVPVAKVAADPVYATEHVRKTTAINLTVSPSNTVTGIDEILGDAEAADADAEYFTISGVRVMGDPAPGIYVVRRGNKVTKEVVK